MPERNDYCPCRSGKKYKHCCAVKRTSSQWIALSSVVVFLLIAAWAVTEAVRQTATVGTTPPGKEWSAEHGHWHDSVGEPGDEQPGGAPPGKVWSTDHGHWHDASSQPRPPGPPPPGKVWSEAHGHWHDADPG